LASQKSSRALETLAMALVLIALVLAPLPIGSESPWARSTMFIMVAAAAVAWVLGGVLGGTLHVVRSTVLVFIAAFFAIGVLQVIPVPKDVLGFVSPNAGALREQALGIGNVPASEPFSLNPYATRAALMRYATCALVFVLLASLIRSRRAVTVAIAVLLAAGLFQVVYALFERLSESGGQEVFWVPKTVYETKFSGTFFNKNHFAGFLEMLLPLALALVVAVRVRSRARREWSARQTLLHVIQAPESQTRMILSVPVVLLAVGVAFSLSRLGVVCAAAGVAGVMSVALFNERRGTSAVIGAVLVVSACIVLAFASGPLLASFEGVTSGRMLSMSGRIDRVWSGWAMIQDFPLAGTGLGTLVHVAGRYQSANLGNIYMMYLANDWLQVACEAGLPGLLVVGAGLLLFLRSTFAAAMHRSRYPRWVAVGCLMGVIAMMLHSFGDFNLIRTTSNAMLFAALLAVAHAAVHAEKEKQAEGRSERPGQVALRLGPAPLRVAVGLFLIVPLLMLAGREASVAQGDLRFNWYLHFTDQPTGLYFFLPLPKPPADAKAAAGLELEEAIRLDPANPLYAYAAGSRQMAEIDRRVAEVGEALVVEALGLGVLEQMKGDPDVAGQLRPIFERDAPELLAEEIKKDGLLDAAEAAYRKAVRLAPTVPEYHIALARSLELKARIAYSVDPASRAWEDVRAEFHAELRRAVYLAPTRPYVLYDAAELYLVDAVRMGGSEHARAVKLAQRLLRGAIYGAPSELAPKAYEALTSAGVDNAGLLAATPRTLRACRELCRFLWMRGPLSDPATLRDILVALDQMEELLGEVRSDALDIDSDAAIEPGPRQEPKQEQDEEPDERQAEPMPPSFSWGSETRSTAQLQLEIAEKRVAVLGLMGDWPRRLDALGRYNSLLDRCVRDKLGNARTLLQKGRYELAMAEYREVLKSVPHNVDALIGMAQVMSVPYLRDMAPDAYGPVECLFRAVVSNESVSREQCADIRRIIADQRAESGRDKVLAEFTDCAAVLVESGGATPQTSQTAAIHRLQKLIASHDEAELVWRDRHLLWYWLGMAYEAKGDDATAREMYEGALKALPGHRRSLERLVALLGRAGDHDEAKYAALLSTLTPDQRCTTTFGGCVTLLGYSIKPGQNMIHYYWEFAEPLPASYKVRSYFLDRRWRDRGVDSRTIVREGGIYTADLARSGEVIVEHRSLRNVASDVAFIGLALSSKTPPQKWPRHLFPDGGPGAVVRFPLIRPAPAAEADVEPSP